MIVVRRSSMDDITHWREYGASECRRAGLVAECPKDGIWYAVGDESNRETRAAGEIYLPEHDWRVLCVIERNIKSCRPEATTKNPDPRVDGGWSFFEELADRPMRDYRAVFLAYGWAAVPGDTAEQSTGNRVMDDYRRISEVRDLEKYKDGRYKEIRQRMTEFTIRMVLR